MGDGMLSQAEYRLQQAARTQVRLTRFGLTNLRTYDVFALRRVAIPVPDIEQSPLLSRAQDSIEAFATSEALCLKEQFQVSEMRDMAYQDVFNPSEAPNSVYFD